MLLRLFSVCCILLAMSITTADAASIAVVDFADEWTKVDALRQTLDEFDVEYDDLTDELEGGQLQFKPENKIFLIGSMTTNNAVLHQNLDKNAKEIQKISLRMVVSSGNRRKLIRMKQMSIGCLLN